MVKVREIMTGSVLTLQIDHLVEDAARMLTDFNVSGAPVCDSNGQLVGIFSKTNLADRVGNGELKSTDTVGEHMSPSVTVISQEDPLIDGIRMMAEGNVRRLPVLDEKGDLAGILTVTDILRAIADGRLPVTW